MKMGMCIFLQCTSLKSSIHFYCAMLHVPEGIFIISLFQNQDFENSRSCSSSIHLLYTNSIPFFFATSSAC
jgi:hypothetical protein